MANNAAKYMVGMRERVAHTLAHVRGESDYCPRELVADESRGLAGQVELVLLWHLTGEQREAVAREYGADGWAELSLMMGGSALDVEPWEGLDWSAVADAIETVTEDDEEGPIQWDGDAFRLPTCHMLASDGEFCLGHDDLSVETLRDGDGDIAHIRACWGLGGPNVWLVRDWDGDRLVATWGFDREEYRGGDVTALLDAYAEMFDY